MSKDNDLGWDVDGYVSQVQVFDPSEVFHRGGDGDLIVFLIESRPDPQSLGEITFIMFFSLCGS